MWVEGSNPESALYDSIAISILFDNETIKKDQIDIQFRIKDRILDGLK